MNNSINGNENQNGKSQQPAQSNPNDVPPEKDSRQQAIEQEDDTARLRSERKSVEDGSGNPLQE